LGAGERVARQRYRVLLTRATQPLLVRSVNELREEQSPSAANLGRPRRSDGFRCRNSSRGDEIRRDSASRGSGSPASTSAYKAHHVKRVVEILRFPSKFTGKYKRPKPFGGMGKPVDEDGFSDHFPIGMKVTEED
jgi:hypothetical protein